MKSHDIGNRARSCDIDECDPCFFRCRIKPYSSDGYKGELHSIDRSLRMPTGNTIPIIVVAHWQFIDIFGSIKKQIESKAKGDNNYKARESHDRFPYPVDLLTTLRCRHDPTNSGSSMESPRPDAVCCRSLLANPQHFYKRETGYFVTTPQECRNRATGFADR